MLKISAENVMYASVQWILSPGIMCFDSTALKNALFSLENLAFFSSLGF